MQDIQRIKVNSALHSGLKMFQTRFTRKVIISRANWSAPLTSSSPSY